jgi:CDP-glycerol glycerophosphotransferase (TagB/SpsB family)
MKFNNFCAIFLWPIYFLSGFFPRSRKVWVFGSYAESFTDNAKQVFLSKNSSESTKDVEFVWITGSRTLVEKLRGSGLKAFWRWSLAGIYYSLRAGLFFYSSYPTDIHFWLSRNAVLVNLWHGLPLKKIEFDIKKGILADIFSPKSRLKGILNEIFYPWHYKKPDYVLTPSEKVARLFQSAFRITDKNCLFYGYPRNEKLYLSRKEALESVKMDGEEELKELAAEIEKHKKTIIYMPTWRDNQADVLSKAKFDIEKTGELLLKNDSLLILKLHPNVKLPDQAISNHANIKIAGSKIDVYSLLPLTDILVTDYSSIFFDYLLLDRRIIFFPFDMEEYLCENREMYFSYNDFVPGSIVLEFEILLEKIFMEESDSERAKRSNMKKTFWEFSSRNSSKMIIERFAN